MDIKPCPFCGSTASVYNARYFKRRYVMCDNYPSYPDNPCFRPMTIEYDTEEEAIIAWNRRVKQ